MGLHINHPRVIATARADGITELQALRKERSRDIASQYMARNPAMILVTLKKGYC